MPLTAFLPGTFSHSASRKRDVLALARRLDGEDLRVVVRLGDERGRRVLLAVEDQLHLGDRVVERVADPGRARRFPASLGSFSVHSSGPLSGTGKLTIYCQASAETKPLTMFRGELVGELGEGGHVVVIDHVAEDVRGHVVVARSRRRSARRSTSRCRRWSGRPSAGCAGGKGRPARAGRAGSCGRRRRSCCSRPGPRASGRGRRSTRRPA